MRGLAFERQEWRDHAACKGQYDIFFPEDAHRYTVEAAKAICRTCPVQMPCAEEGLRWKQPYVWGGLSEQERRSIRAKRRRDRQGQPSPQEGP